MPGSMLISLGGRSNVTDRNKSTGVFIAGSEWADSYAGRVQGHEGYFVLLSEGTFFV